MMRISDGANVVGTRGAGGAFFVTICLGGTRSQ